MGKAGENYDAGKQKVAKHRRRSLASAVVACSQGRTYFRTLGTVCFGASSRAALGLSSLAHYHLHRYGRQVDNVLGVSQKRNMQTMPLRIEYLSILRLGFERSALFLFEPTGEYFSLRLNTLGTLPKVPYRAEQAYSFTATLP